MERKTAYYERDLEEPLSPITYTGNMFTGDDGADLFAIGIRKGGVYQRITDEVKGHVTRADGKKISVAGSTEGNIAIIQLSRDCYRKEGPIQIAIIVGETTVGLINGTVYKASSFA